MRYVFWMLSDAAKADNLHYRQELKHKQRDQRPVSFSSRLPVGPVSPSTTPVPLRKPCARHDLVFADCRNAAGFRLWLGGGRCAPASIR